MKSSAENGSPKRILLTGVFGPYGVDDAYGRKENVMELFHNQVTKAQGVASFRFQHRSFGLYFIAENIDADVTVLDFPTKQRFEQELHKGYDMVGISFIVPNFKKAQEMARMTRELAPGATIVLGGHGAAAENVEKLIECDHVVKGEGIRAMRRLLGQDPDAPIKHPILPSAERASIYGVPLPGSRANLLVPGVGCINGCKFCSTSHFFGKKYTSYLSTGQAMFKTACEIADATGDTEFFVMDENFLKDKERALDFLAEMEKHERYFEFNLFSSAESIYAFGLDNLVRLGVNYLWIGVESSSSAGNYEKNKGVDARALVQALRDRGIMVLASGILCMEHHTQENMQKDIDFMVGLESDFVQFMLFTPLPVTALYQEHKKRGVLKTELPFEEWHGQKMLSWNHPHFPGDSAEKWLNAAFRQDYEVNGSSMFRVMTTSFRGYKRLAGLKERDKLLDYRFARAEKQVRHYAQMIGPIAGLPVNQRERSRALALVKEIDSILPPTLSEKLARPGAFLLAAAWKIRLKLRGDAIQPKTIFTEYKAGRAQQSEPLPSTTLKKAETTLKKKVASAAAAAMAVL